MSGVVNETLATVSPPDSLGRVSVAFRSQTLIAHMTWHSIDAMQKQHGKDFLAIVSKALDVSEIASMSSIMAQCCRLEGEAELLTYEEAQAIGFPIIAMRQALTLSWKCAWYGGEMPDEVEETEGKKRNPLVTLLSPLLRVLSERESNGASSGT